MSANSTRNAAATNQDELSSRVRLVLDQSVQPAFRQVDVDHEDGTIVLSGQLPSFYLKQIAQTVVSRVDGVRNLDNRVQVVRKLAATA